MRKIKFMLVSLGILALGGGMLAFKAKFNLRYCTTNAILIGGGTWICPINAKCPNLAVNVTTDNALNYFCVTTPTEVVGQSTCFTSNDPDQTLDCFDITKLKLQ